MKVQGVPYRTIWFSAKKQNVEIIDQTSLPFEFKIVELRDLESTALAIQDMWVRGAPLIGAAAAY